MNYLFENLIGKGVIILMSRTISDHGSKNRKTGPDV